MISFATILILLRRLLPFDANMNIIANDSNIILSEEKKFKSFLEILIRDKNKKPNLLPIRRTVSQINEVFSLRHLYNLPKDVFTVENTYHKQEFIYKLCYNNFKVKGK